MPGPAAAVEGHPLDFVRANCSLAGQMHLLTHKGKKAATGDGLRVPAGLLAREGTIWLDSVVPAGDRGRYSIVVWDPVAELTCGPAAARDVPWPQHRFGSVEELLAEVERLTASGTMIAAGHITYEAGVAWLGLPTPATDLPPARFFVYDRAFCFDHRTIEPTRLHPGLPCPEDIPEDHTDVPPEPDLAAEVSVVPSMSRDRYRACVERLLGHIHEGDIYQGNLTLRFETAVPLPPEAVYYRLRKKNPAPYGAFLNAGDIQVLSSSPERLLFKQGDRVTCGPIKGTAPRGRTALETRRQRERLQSSEKDRAELLMIVDLLRNDLGRVARTGSVCVDRLFAVETFASVIHLVGDISCRLRPGIGLAELMAALLPFGSITGAPKRRAVEILNEVETVPRGIYTGCLGYVCGDRAEFSVAIRTMSHRAGTYHVHAGGGIVADSRPEAEYAELCLKARKLIEALGGLL